MSTPTPFPALDGLSERDQRAALADFFVAEQARLGLRPSEDFDRVLGELRTGVKREAPPAPVSAPVDHPPPSWAEFLYSDAEVAEKLLEIGAEIEALLRHVSVEVLPGEYASDPDGPAPRGVAEAAEAMLSRIDEARRG